MQTTAVSKRFYSLDALRAVAMLLGIYVHATHSFFIEQWSGVKDVTSSVLLPVTYMFFHLFRLHTFFLVAGFFSRMLYHRDGPAKMMQNRSQRILLPFLVGCVTLLPLMHIMQLFGKARAESPDAGFPWDKILPYFTSGEFLNNYTSHYLWFLEYLMIFYAIVVIAYPLLSRMDETWRLRERADRWMVYLTASRKAPLWLAVPTFFAMFLMLSPMGDEPGFSFVPSPLPIAHYGLFFAFGWMLHRHSDRLENLKGLWKKHLIPALSLFAFFALIIVIAMTFFQPPSEPVGASGSNSSAGQAGQIVSATDTIQDSSSTIPIVSPEITDASFVVNSATAEVAIASASAAIGEASPMDGGPPEMPGLFSLPLPAIIGLTLLKWPVAYLMWAFTLATVGLFVEYFDRPNPLFRYIADSAYWLYLAHVPVLMYMQIVVAYWPIPWFIKIVIVLGITLIILFVTYRFFVRSTWIGAILNGRRYPRALPILKEAQPENTALPLGK